MKWPKIPLGLRLFLPYCVLVLLTAYLVTTTVIREIKPNIRQATEETLVDMANLLAEMASNEMAAGQFADSELAQILSSYGKRKPNAAIWGVGKSSMNHRIYVTDHQGIVIADSWQQDIGADFSKWNDVYLTLRGRYGARSTSLDPNDPLSSVMHVAAPIKRGDKIIGSVTVAKANRSVQPFIDNTKRRIVNWLIIMIVLALVMGAAITWRINTALTKLAVYADKLGRGEKHKKPTFRVFYEYTKLRDALTMMRSKLDGKQYVEQYVETLTHELKSPLSAIKGASEILQQPLSQEKTQLFANNIAQQTERMQQLIERMLALTKLEKKPELDNKQEVNLNQIIKFVLESQSSKVARKKVQLNINSDSEVCINGDTFLLQQAIFNLIDNALDFVNVGAEISIELFNQQDKIILSVKNEGPHIPDYALTKVTQRFYSLPRENGVKSTGLGLNFVEQVAHLHNAELTIKNVDEGVMVSLTFNDAESTDST